MRTRKAPTSVELLTPTPGAEDPDIAAQQALFKTLVVTVEHFFGGFAPLFRSLTDRRDPARLTYHLWTLMATGVLMFLFRLGARRRSRYHRLTRFDRALQRASDYRSRH